MPSQGYSDPAARLLKLGDIRTGGSWPNYLRMGLAEADIPELIRMATDPQLNTASSESDEVWAPVHAWRALGQLKAEAAVEPLLSLFHGADEEDDWIADEMPGVFGLIGPAAILPLRQYLLDPGHGLMAKIATASCLREIGEEHPESRDEVVAVLTQLMERHEENDEVLNGEIVACLMGLDAVEAVPAMKRAFDAGTVAEDICGDWEDVQLALGVIDERRTPRPSFLQRFFGWNAHPAEEPEEPAPEAPHPEPQPLPAKPPPKKHKKHKKKR